MSEAGYNHVSKHLFTFSQLPRAVATSLPSHVSLHPLSLSVLAGPHLLPSSPRYSHTFNPVCFPPPSPAFKTPSSCPASPQTLMLQMCKPSPAMCLLALPPPAIKLSSLSSDPHTDGVTFTMDPRSLQELVQAAEPRKASTQAPASLVSATVRNTTACTPCVPQGVGCHPVPLSAPQTVCGLAVQFVSHFVMQGALSLLPYGLLAFGCNSYNITPSARQSKRT